MFKSVDRVLAGILVLVLGACGGNPAQTEIESIAKDWSRVVRASQVIPIYPLSEDVRPGDVFVVPVPIAEQARLYDERGYMPIDQQVTRLTGLNYEEFYKDPFPGTLPSSTAPAAQTSGSDNTCARADRNLPHAAFPSYTFSVTRQAGLSIALPLQGVPLGFGFMGAESARGTVNLSKAFTYGVSGEDAYRKLLEWVGSDPSIKDALAAMEKQTDDGGLFLRVVNRVYLISGVTVSLQNTSDQGAGARVGAAPSLPAPSAETPADHAAQVQALATQYNVLSEALATLNTAVAPGGSLRFGQLSASGVTMEECFEKPFIIGFVGFDLKVLPNGELSAPLPSFQVLQGDLTSDAFSAAPRRFIPGPLDGCYIKWLAVNGHTSQMEKFLISRDQELQPIALAGNPVHRSLVQQAAEVLGFCAKER